MIYRLYTIPIVVFLVVFAVSSYLVTTYQRLAEKEQVLLMSQIIASEGANIERRLSRSLSSTYILASLVRKNGGELNDFEYYAADIISSLGGISNLQLAPNGIINEIYPLIGQEKALGHNILKDDARKNVAKQAIKTGKLTLAGPFQLLQGGTAVIGRNPIFLPNGEGKEEFWGFASALVYLEDLLASTDLELLKEQGYSYQISRVSQVTGEREVFSGQKEALENFVAHIITVPNAKWELLLGRKPSSPAYFVPLLFIFSAVIALLLGYLTYILVRQPVVLSELVKKRTEELEKLAFYDPLTGLCNRRLFNDYVGKMIDHTARSDNRLALLYLDIDDFKRINDSMGHDAGDELLKAVAGKLQSTLRTSNIIARLGGDEFCLLVSNWRTIEILKIVAERTLSAFSEPFSVQDRKVFITPSIGITIAGQDGDNVGDLLKHADMAMYAAKNSGKNDYRFFNDKMNKEINERVEIEHSLREALEQNQFVLHYQPIVQLSPTRVIALEALVRWQHPTKGLIFPDQFINVCEETGLIVPLGYWVLRQACKDLRKLEEIFPSDVRICINVSQRQFSDPSMAMKFSQTLQENKVNANKVELELTESMVMQEVQYSVGVMHLLKEMGFNIAIDDFGTGYSSLSRLKGMPVDTLKIDRSFIMDIGKSSESDQLVQVIIAIAEKLNLSVIAEGIEEEMQKNFLINSGCTVGQGYYFGKPQAIEQLEKYQLPMTG